MRRLALCLIFVGLLAQAQDFIVLSPQGTIYGYAYPDGSYHTQQPSAGILNVPKDNSGRIQTNNTYGYQSGDTTIILQPGQQGSSFGYSFPK